MGERVNAFFALFALHLFDVRQHFVFGVGAREPRDSQRIDVEPGECDELPHKPGPTQLVLERTDRYQSGVGWFQHTTPHHKK